ncbi:hypothetical protein P3X46_007151 [Hevea brasiliensis]|uniref:Uncharacterized protein n=1 Tax=Hevea brasiliensis TaxID=3981 RepID=A0ABQ9MSJ8_HEVBR|nr:hypothetical protein P3X46_007151 [Hevea brasiliensis]
MRFVKRKEAHAKREEKGKKEAQQMPINNGSSGTIHMIVRGPTTCEKRGRKRKGIQGTREFEMMQINQQSMVVVTFSTEDDWGAKTPYEDASVLIDNESKVNLLPYHVLQLIKINDEQLTRSQACIKGIGGVSNPMEKKIQLPLTLGQVPLTQTRYATFLVFKLSMLYNAIMGRPVLYDFKIATSIRYLIMKFPIDEGSLW